MSPHVLAILNDPDSSLGRYAGWLTEAGLEVTVRPGPEGLPQDLSGYAGLVMLGAGLMPDDDVQAPWLPDERRLAGAALEQEVPVLGICLGGQLLAMVGGGQVRTNYGPIERGATQIHLTPAAEGDDLFGVCPSAFYAIENHRDAITALPPEAVHLAYSTQCPNQAFRLGPAAWGLQFHPEASAENVARWDQAKVRADGFEPDDLLQFARSVEPESARVCRTVAEGFAHAVRRYAGSPPSASG